MAEPTDSSLQFFSKGAPVQYKYVLGLYKEVMLLKAHQSRGARKGGPEELIKLDTWYQEQLHKTIHSRKETYVTHEELVQITKWKLMRGKIRPRLVDLVRINTELAVRQATKKAFKKLPNLTSAINALTNLKGVGPSTASAVLTAGFPDICPYMADESMLATPGVEATDYTLAEYLNFSEQIKQCTERLKAQDPNGKWTPHIVELVLWTHYLAKQLNPSLLDSLPKPDTKPVTPDPPAKAEENSEVTSTAVSVANGSTEKYLDEDSNVSVPASDGDEKSNDSNSQNNHQLILKKGTDSNSNDFRHPSGNGRDLDESDISKDGLVPSSEENSRNVFITTEDNSNLSNLSSEDVTTTSGGENTTNDSTVTADRLLNMDGPALKKLRAE